MFGFHFELLFAGFANPMVLSFDEGMVMNSLPAVFNAQITLHIL
jgi:hypothetical protein